MMQRGIRRPPQSRVRPAPPDQRFAQNSGIIEQERFASGREPRLGRDGCNELMAIDTLPELRLTTCCTTILSISERGDGGDELMIARLWQGSVPVAKADSYGAFLAGFGVDDYRRVPGHLGASLFRRDSGDVSHFMFLSYWSSRAALEAYAGPNFEKAFYYQYDLDCLLNPPELVDHFEVLASTGSPCIGLGTEAQRA
jgi:hypothetical protein